MKKRKIKYKKLITFILIIIIISFSIYKLFNTNINTIYILNNKYLTKDEILNILNINENSKLIKTILIENKLSKSDYIIEGKIYHKNIFDLYIKLEENIPLYYNNNTKETILLDGKKVNKKYSVPTLITSIPEKQNIRFNKEMKKVNIDILNKISEISYKPSEKDENLFLLSMTDGNYVYLTLDRFDNINTYLDIMNKLEHKIKGQKGILYLDSGNYFDIL